VEAHRLGVVHRDLKPQNIMIDDAGDVKIMDFGIARSVEAPGVTQTGVMIGTPDYISPEQAEGEEADHRADIYAFGVILYGMMTGRVPFKGDTALSVALKHKSKMPSEPKELNPDVSKDLNKLILICMEKERERRYQTAADLLTDIQNIQEGIPLGERKLPKKKREIKWKSILLYGGVPLLSVLIIVGGIYLYVNRAATIDSMAVLPFENLTGNSEQEYFGDWITDELTGKLSRVGTLRIISYRTMRRYKGSDKSLQEIAQELNIDVFVTGTVQQVGANVSIRVQLIDVLPEEQSLWEETYDRVMTDVLLMNSEIARTIAQEVRAEMTPEAETRVASSRQVNPKAYEAYVKGKFYMNQGTPEAYQKGLALHHQAVEIDPSDPLAYAYLAEAYITVAHSVMATPDALPRAKAAAQRALRLDDTLAEALWAYGFIAGYYDWEWEASEQAFQRALEINPNLAMAHYHLSWFQYLFGRMEEAIESHKRAQEVDPLTPLHTAWLGELYRVAGRYEEAIAEAQRALEINPKFPISYRILGDTYLDMGMIEEAVATHEKMVEIVPGWSFHLGMTYAEVGREDEAREILAEWEKKEVTPIVANALAKLNTALGNVDEAFRWLNYEPAHAWTPWVRVGPVYNPLHGDPRFDELLRKFNLPPLDDNN
jgi:TolB-like protein/Tfp pilus assembly protein PilF